MGGHKRAFGGRKWSSGGSGQCHGDLPRCEAPRSPPFPHFPSGRWLLLKGVITFGDGAEQVQSFASDKRLKILTVAFPTSVFYLVTWPSRAWHRVLHLNYHHKAWYRVSLPYNESIGWHRAKNRVRDKAGLGMYNLQNVENSSFGQPVCVCVSAGLSVCLFVCLSSCLCVCLSVCVSVCLTVRLSVRRSVCRSVCLTVRLSVCPSVCLAFAFP